MIPLLAGVFLASLAGSAHCGGMCGPLVAIYTGLPGTGAAWKRRAGLHAAYSGGRLAAYATLGTIGGALGAALDRAGALAGIGRAAAIVSGFLVLLSGLLALAGASGHAAPPFARRLFGRVFQAAARRSALTRSALLGVGTALLPCGWLYTFVVTAAGTGHPLGGASVMTAFWAGTLPVMVAFGEAVRLMAAPVRRHLPRASAVLLIVLGLLTVFGRAHVVTDASVPPCHGTR